MNCQVCSSNVAFASTTSDLPNMLKCNCCDWFYEWRGALSREQVEQTLQEMNAQQWVELKAGRLRLDLTESGAVSLAEQAAETKGDGGTVPF